MLQSLERQVESPAFGFEEELKEAVKVFDVARYKDTPAKRRIRTIAADLSGFCVEAGDKSLEERINPFYVAVLPDGRVINLVSREEVTKNFSTASEFAQKETQGARDFYYHQAQKAEEGDLLFWFSPSHGKSNYKEARITVAKVRTLFGMKVLECYGIPTKLAPHELLGVANYFRAMAEESPILDPENLREICLLYPALKDQAVWQELAANIPLDSPAWREIAAGSPRQIKRQAYKEALPIAKKMDARLKSARTVRDFVVIGAMAEMMMAQKGWKINSYQCEGSLNSSLLNTTPNTSYVIDAMGNMRQVTSGEKQILKCVECPFCHKTVDAEIYGGEIHCPDKPKGCGKSVPLKNP